VDVAFQLVYGLLVLQLHLEADGSGWKLMLGVIIIYSP